MVVVGDVFLPVIDLFSFASDAVPPGILSTKGALDTTLIPTGLAFDQFRLTSKDAEFFKETVCQFCACLGFYGVSCSQKRELLSGNTKRKENRSRSEAASQILANLNPSSAEPHLVDIECRDKVGWPCRYLTTVSLLIPVK